MCFNINGLSSVFPGQGCKSQDPPAVISAGVTRVSEHTQLPVLTPSINSLTANKDQEITSAE